MNLTICEHRDFRAEARALGISLGEFFRRAAHQALSDKRKRKIVINAVLATLVIIAIGVWGYKREKRMEHRWAGGNMIDGISIGN